MLVPKDKALDSKSGSIASQFIGRKARVTRFD
jgi:hypothetical protein